MTGKQRIPLVDYRAMAHCRANPHKKAPGSVWRRFRRYPDPIRALPMIRPDRTNTAAPAVANISSTASTTRGPNRSSRMPREAETLQRE